MSKEQDIEYVKNTIQMLVYEEALDLLVEQYIREFVYQEDVPCLHTYYLEKNLKETMIEKATDKISKLITVAYKDKFGLSHIKLKNKKKKENSKCQK